ncbi:hypothetical protein ACFX2G_047351 [Malus domestica]
MRVPHLLGLTENLKKSSTNLEKNNGSRIGPRSVAICIHEVRGQNHEIQVVGVPQASSQAGAVDEFVDKECMVGGDARAEELDYGSVVAATEGGELVFEFGDGELDAELALENDGIFST